jgi:hypothetical protein
MDSVKLSARMWVPGCLKESDDLQGNLRGDLGGDLRGEPHWRAKSDDCGACYFSNFWKCNPCFATLGNNSVGAASPLLNEARPIEYLSDNRIVLNRIMLTG